MSTSLSRRDFLRMASLAVGGTVLAACGAPAAPSQSSEVKPTSGAPAAAKVTMRFWSHNNVAFVAMNETLVKQFMDANPNVTVKYENFPYDEFIKTIQTSMAAKNEADVMEMFGSWVQSYAKGGTLAPLPEGMMTYAKAQEIFYAAPLDGYVWEGKVFGLPNEYNLENGGVLINDRMFKDAGVTDPPAWTNWDALVSDAKKMTKMDGSTMTVAGFDYVTGDGLGFLYWEGVLERGADYFAADKIHLDFLSPQAEATVQWLVDMSLKDKVVDATTFNASVNGAGEFFFQGQTAIGYIGPWYVPVARTTYADFKDPWTYVSCPYYGDKMSFAADAGWGKVVSPNSKDVETSWTFAQYMTVDAKNARAWNVGTGTIPAQKSVAADPTLLTDLNWIGPSLKVLPYGKYVGMLQDRDFIWYNVVSTHITECMQGMRSVKETMALMNDDANKMIDSKLKA
jgi:multiple sugar transport system substrate-binding protein